MADFFGGYKIVKVADKTGIITSNHKTKELLVSKDINLKRTKDGKLCAIFPEFNKNGKVSGEDCSVTISNPPGFNHCVKKDGMYQVSGSNIAFNGTDNADILILNGCENSEINMGAGNDVVLYRENKILNNNINLGNGNNVFTPRAQTDKDMPLQNNKISSGKSQDYIYLRNAVGNDVETGDGNDIVEIEGAPYTKFSNQFKNNLINTGKGNDNVNIHGIFDKFSGNEFYLGKGSDNFSAEINPNKDAATEVNYQNNLSEYVNNVSGNKIYATDGEKGLFEKNTFESKTHSANQLSEYNNMSAVSEGFQNHKIKPVPKNQTIIPQEKETINLSKESKIENAKKRYYAGSLGYNLFKDPKMQKAAFKALDDYVNLMN